MAISYKWFNRCNMDKNEIKRRVDSRYQLEWTDDRTVKIPPHVLPPDFMYRDWKEAILPSGHKMLVFGNYTKYSSYDQSDGCLYMAQYDSLIDAQHACESRYAVQQAQEDLKALLAENEEKDKTGEKELIGKLHFGPTRTLDLFVDPDELGASFNDIQIVVGSQPGIYTMLSALYHEIMEFSFSEHHLDYTSPQYICSSDCFVFTMNHLQFTQSIMYATQAIYEGTKLITKWWEDHYNEDKPCS